MIQVKDSHGNPLFEVKEDSFPLQIPVDTVTGRKVYKMYLNHLRKTDGTKDRSKVKNINLGIDRD